MFSESKSPQAHKAVSHGKRSREDISIWKSFDDIISKTAKVNTSLDEDLPVLNSILSVAKINSVNIYVNKT